MRRALSSLLRKNVEVAGACFLFFSIWLSKDEAMEILAMLVHWLRCVREGVIKAWSGIWFVASPMTRTTAKKRWLEDGRGGVMSMVVLCGTNPSKKDGGSDWTPSKMETIAKVRSSDEGRRSNIHQDGVWSRIGKRKPSSINGEARSLELTWSGWQKIRINRLY
ncbi:unnamed protein product [Linum trigynum]|uniref:Uncharacterized protein n=1 Tax=Linum trigynum TaxID=586398 RepID=A0AAV2E632_9ROSI